jgi:hypothetical protein
MSASAQADTSAISHFPVPVWPVGSASSASSASSSTAPDDSDLTARTLPSPAPISCQPWCEANNGHPNQRLREDQCCFGIEHRVPLSHEPSVLIGEASTEQQYLSTYLMRSADDAASRVFIGYNEAPGRAATLEEARQFAHAILRLVDGLEG